MNSTMPCLYAKLGLDFSRNNDCVASPQLAIAAMNFCATEVWCGARGSVDDTPRRQGAARLPIEAHAQEGVVARQSGVDLHR